MSYLQIKMRKIIVLLDKSIGSAHKCREALQEFQRDADMLREVFPNVCEDDDDEGVFLNLSTLVTRTQVWIEMICMVKKNINILLSADPETRRSLDVVAMFREIDSALTMICDTQDNEYRLEPFEWEKQNYDIAECIENFVTSVIGKLIDIAKFLRFPDVGTVGIPCIDTASEEGKRRNQIVTIYMDHLTDLNHKTIYNEMHEVMNCLYTVRKFVPDCRRNIIASNALDSMSRVSAMDAYREGVGSEAGAEMGGL
jgi:hypothetical protein